MPAKRVILYCIFSCVGLSYVLLSHLVWLGCHSSVSRKLKCPSMPTPLKSAFHTPWLLKIVNANEACAGSIYDAASQDPTILTALLCSSAIFAITEKLLTILLALLAVWHLLLRHMLRIAWYCFFVMVAFELARIVLAHYGDSFLPKTVVIRSLIACSEFQSLQNQLVRRFVEAILWSKGYVLAILNGV